MTKLIIADDIHLQDFLEGQSLNYLLKKLNEMRFEIVTEIDKPNILIFRNPAYKSSTKQTHIVINLNDLIADIYYYLSEFCRCRVLSPVTEVWLWL
ncbi:MAG: hypothetical protein WKG06_45750 [Segetibacter sp.]